MQEITTEQVERVAQEAAERAVDERAEAIAVKAAEKAVDLMLERIYTEVGRTVAKRILWVLGLGALALAVWLIKAGKIAT